MTFLKGRGSAEETKRQSEIGVPRSAANGAIGFSLSTRDVEETEEDAEGK